jgi:hypothetical protein
MKPKIYASLIIFTVLAQQVDAKEKRCGWLDNPTPSNFWLKDKNGSWLISEQGGFFAEGDVPDMDISQFVVLNGGSYGYGCICLTVTTDKKKKRILKIFDSKQLPLKTCLEDLSLPRP